jgi:hypothetical protein
MDDRRSGDHTEAQKQAYWQSVRGKQVTWSGQVDQVEITSGGRITLKCNPQSWGSDVSVNLDGTQIQMLPSIQRGTTVTVKGLLEGHSMFGYTLTNGQIFR